VKLKAPKRGREGVAKKTTYKKETPSGAPWAEQKEAQRGRTREGQWGAP